MLKIFMLALALALSISSMNSYGANLSCPGTVNSTGRYTTETFIYNASPALKSSYWVLLPQGLGAVSSRWGAEAVGATCVLISADKLKCGQSNPNAGSGIRLAFTLNTPYMLYGTYIYLYGDELFTQRLDYTRTTTIQPKPEYTFDVPNVISFGDMRLGETKETTINARISGHSDNPVYMTPQWTEKEGVRLEPSGDLASSPDGSQWILKDNGDNKLKVFVSHDATPGVINVPVNLIHDCM